MAEPITLMLTAASGWAVSSFIASTKQLSGGWFEARYDDDLKRVQVTFGLAPPVNKASRILAWTLYVELLSGVAVVPMPHDEGLDREALSSLHRLFQNVRAALVMAGPDAAAVVPDHEQDASVGAVVLFILNAQLRPFLSLWHPQLSIHEARREPTVSAYAHEQRWAHHLAFRDHLGALQRDLSTLAKGLEGTLALQPAASLRLPYLVSPLDAQARKAE